MASVPLPNPQPGNPIVSSSPELVSESVTALTNSPEPANASEPKEDSSNNPEKTPPEKKISTLQEGKNIKTPRDSRLKPADWAGLISMLLGIIGGLLLVGRYISQGSDEVDLPLFLLSFPMLGAPTAWFVSGKDEEVGKLIRREVVSSAVGLLIVFILNSRVGGEVQKSIQTGALSLMTGALLISTCRVLIEAIHVCCSHFRPHK